MLQRSLVIMYLNANTFVTQTNLSPSTNVFNPVYFSQILSKMKGVVHSITLVILILKINNKI